LKIMNSKLLSTIGLLYALLLIYASLMPFDFSSAIDINIKIKTFWSYWPINPRARISGSDLVSNLALYIPLGWIIAVRLRLGNIKSLFSMALSVLICFAISMCVEFLQMFTVSRISSASDWLLNTISGFTGAAFGIFFGKELWIIGIKWLKQSWETRPVIIATVIFAGLLTADALSPYLPTILLKQVWQSLKHSNFNLIQGLSAHPWHWWIAQRGLVYLILTILIAGCLQGKGRSVFWNTLFAAATAALLCFFLEIGKLFIVSRSFNIANLATSWAGCCMAVWIGWKFAGKVSAQRKLELAICFLIFHVFYLGWFPFDFTWNYERIQKVFPSPVKLLPLYDYAMGATLNHARLFTQSIFLLGMLIYLLRIRFNCFNKPVKGIWLAAILCGMLGLLQEGGQFLLESRTPSATDIYCFAMGGGMGAWIKRPQIFR